jgi:hypothetical protein
LPRSEDEDGHCEGEQYDYRAGRDEHSSKPDILAADNLIFELNLKTCRHGNKPSLS